MQILIQMRSIGRMCIFLSGLKNTTNEDSLRELDLVLICQVGGLGTILWQPTWESVIKMIELDSSEKRRGE